VTVTASPPPVSKKGLNLVLRPEARVPWCQDYRGTGAIPHGYVLLIFDTPGLSNGTATSYVAATNNFYDPLDAASFFAFSE
jgi:hypothetical protein